MLTVVISGANRGLGLEFATQYAAEGARVFAGAREPETATALNEAAKKSDGKLTVHRLDVASASSVGGFMAAVCERPVDILIANAGVFGGANQHRLGSINYDEMIETFSINTLGVLRLGEALSANLKTAQGKFIAITSRMGSIGEARGGFYGYRASKAALNMLMHALANDLKGDGIIAIPMSPGWAKTDMGGQGAPQEAASTVAQMRRRIAAYHFADSGRFLDWQGRELPW